MVPGGVSYFCQIALGLPCVRGHERDHPQRAAAAAFNLHRQPHDKTAGARQRRQIGQVLEADDVFAVQGMVG